MPKNKPSKKRVLREKPVRNGCHAEVLVYSSTPNMEQYMPLNCQ
jgi:hypothetical protein